VALSLILVIARPRVEPSAEPPPIAGRFDWLSGGLADDDDLRIAYAANPEAAVVAAEQAIAEGRDEVAVVPVGADSPGLPERGADLARLPDLVADSAQNHPAARIVLVSDPSTPTVAEVLDLVQPPGRDDGDLLAETIGRAFGGDTDRFGRFVGTLHRAMPAGTQLALRGSAVQGYAFGSQEPFDARGPGTSDLDVVLFGEEAMASWHPEAFVIPAINTLPLSDGSMWVAPSLDPARSAAQTIARRPVSLQAMARWFMDLRSGLQGTPYAILDAR
jgi:hypothetical protein